MRPPQQPSAAASPANPAPRRRSRRMRARSLGRARVPSPAMRAAVLTISTSLARGEGEDRSGPRLAELLADAGGEVVPVEVVPDDAAAIAARLRDLVDDDVRFVFTTGGTGLTPDDVTPEATRAVIERDAPGLPAGDAIEALRHQPMGLLTRGVSGIAGRTLIVNFPGNPKAIEQLFPVIAPTLEHAAATLAREEPGARH